MATKVITGTVPFPWPLGKVFPGASFATQSVPLTQNIQPTNPDGSNDNQFNGIYIQADANNVGTIYICSNAQAPDLTSFTNVLGEVLAGGWYTRAKEWANNRDISQLYIGAANNTDFVIVILDQM